MTPSDVVALDYQALRYPGRPCPEYKGEIFQETATTPVEIKSGLAFLSYLLHNGHQLIILSSGDLNYRFCAYFSTHESGVTKNLNDEKEYAYALRIPHRLLREVVGSNISEALLNAEKRAHEIMEPVIEIIRRDVDESLRRMD